ncbi:3-hydroxyacyl-ACP dehydratase FabZ [Candidatus Aminicenantes bacterium AC-708-M15]|jgi:3-hydroxyacyl-[acyl-carrier-protein] dehydratase/UDP-3-O-[3-hydroxymyristoyl] N-acetylglucosamine deacetylase/3-hydroxyacyl-[acyl-carrier-protein] dehydratase|nr:3-hydroxyacyl-ACP dehydratase FabZ [SCandidatus Aminicenantes bacterium Aminicenantia_JdfR_composite]MCP2597964.1 3-hydroxyacyl-ACP dehydratase FabZ [Candidatus Aminicenantes bacterium AC-335-L06]MCP2604237.1 3-hydroxyacyl-ACP dehydratase FabZ [Candidatus Aminicenantes bacterium AC-708-M15]MCP2606441.1 3-hydroxyacyl-ACP dehydratase FabZ [Candidatus Aminicenantes bacterium AC-708-I09]MCP2618168.1 3-hydroxyacyl-ACP dehydratase FabZ [Candidatus Aminicenantes bacterium AC-335-A11]
MDIEKILGLLPHRYPFLLVDKIIEIEEGKRIVGIKNVTINEQFFQGHFPKKPVMPGVLILEAMAQTGALLLIGSIPEREKKLIYLTGIEKARFRRPVVPGDQLKMELTLLNLKERFCRIGGKAFVENNLVAEAEILAALVDLEKDEK